MTMDPEEANREAGKKSWLVRLLNHSERVVYYGAAIALIITVGVLTALVISLAAALYFTRRIEREDSGDAG